MDVSVVNGIGGLCEQLFSNFAGHEAARSGALSIAPLCGAHVGSIKCLTSVSSGGSRGTAVFEPPVPRTKYTITEG